MESGKKMIISVAICTYNGAKYIGEQIESILNQDCMVDEIIIGDDGSEDSTVEIAEALLRDSGISYKILKNKTNLGYRKNFENAMAVSKGDIIFLCDQDDVWKPDKVGIMMKHFIQNPGCQMVFSDADIVDSNLHVQKLTLWDTISLNRDRKREKDWRKLFLKGGYVTGAASAVRRELFEQSRPFSEVCVHDAWLAMNAALMHGIETEPKKLFMYRQHGSNQIGVTYSGKDRMLKKREILRNLSRKQMEEHRNKKIIFSEMRERFYPLISRDREFEQFMDEGIRFHESLSSLGTESAGKSLMIIWRNLRRGSYQHFAKTQGMFLADMLYIFLKDRTQACS